MSAALRRALILVVSTCFVSAALVSAADAAVTPAKPAKLSARAATSTAIVSWKRAAHATRYRVCLREDPKQSSCRPFTAPTTRTTATFTGLKANAGTDYYFTVYAYRGSRRTASSAKGFNLKPRPTPAVPSRITQKITAQTLTISWSPSKHARDYSVCLTEGSSTERCSTSSTRSTALTARFTRLKPRRGTDYTYRVYAYNGGVSSRSARQHADLPVLPIAKVAVVPGASGTATATWDPAFNAEAYELQIAANSTMTSGLATYSATGTSATPTKIVLGERYYYRVRGVNGARKGAYTKIAHFRLSTATTRISVMTYNLCGQDKCVTKANKMKKWSTRKAYAGKIARSSDADIIATQESHDKDTRFGTQLPGFGLAAYYSAKSLFYSTAKYSVLRSGTITLSSKEKKYAVWAEFRDKVTRTVFIVADVHLQPYKGKTKDDLRAAQTAVLLSRIAAINTADVPVVYAGDFNSNKSNADQSRYKGGYDAPLKVFARAGIIDTLGKAKGPVHANWNSSNQAANPPIKHGDHIDHIYADPEIVVTAWRVILSLSGADYATPFATDHNPLRAILTVPGR